MSQESQESVSFLKCKTVQGTGVSVLGAAVPLINAELLRMPPSPFVRWLAFGISVGGGLYVIWRRVRSEHPPVKGVL